MLLSSTVMQFTSSAPSYCPSSSDITSSAPAHLPTGSPWHIHELHFGEALALCPAVEVLGKVLLFFLNEAFVKSQENKYSVGIKGKKQTNNKQRKKHQRDAFSLF